MSNNREASFEEVVHWLGAYSLGITHTQKGGKGATQLAFVSNSSAYSKTGWEIQLLPPHWSDPPSFLNIRRL